MTDRERTLARERKRRQRERNKQKREYERKWRSNISGRFCECGKPATKFVSDDFICDECQRLDERNRVIATRRERCGFMTAGLTEYRLLVSL